MADYPAMFDVSRPEKFERPHVFLRLLIVILLGWVIDLVYLAVPIVAAVMISGKGGAKYLEDDAPRMTNALRWLLAAYAYLGILTDKVPTEKPEEVVRYEVKTGGSPTVGSALLRLIMSIPSAFVLALLGIISGIILLIAAVMVLIQESYPEGMYNFQRGILRWEARLLAYHASLVDVYPPFALDTGREDASAAPEPVA